jgi:iron complex transport system substrate-binding protein
MLPGCMQVESSRGTGFLLLVRKDRLIPRNVTRHNGKSKLPTLLNLLRARYNGDSMAREKESAVQRIVSLAPNVTSILLALGAGQELVGVSKWCKHVARVGSRPQLGDCWKLNLDEVMRLKPTLLIGSVPFSKEIVGRILEQPVSFLAINPRSLADIDRDIRTLGLLTNFPRATEKLIQKMHHEFMRAAQIVAGLDKRTRPRVYCEAWPKPRISSPPWVAEMVQIAGAKMAVPAGKRVSDDEIARARPDVIVLAWAATGNHATPEQTLRNPLWRDVPAVKSGRVVVIRDELLNTPGPPLIDGMHALISAIHPELRARKSLDLGKW